MKTIIYNQNGEETGATLLSKEVFDVKINPDLVHQVAVAQMANRRKNIADTKDRSEVRGGGRKPWRQKGTGRARHGSRRSPIWRGGGITFGPTKDIVYSKKINKKMRRKALFMVLSEKFKNNLLIFFDKIKYDEIKTKKAAELIKIWKSKIENFKDGSVLIVLPEHNREFMLAVRNLPKVDIIQAKELNVLDSLSFKYLIMPKDSIKVIQETFAGENLN